MSDTLFRFPCTKCGVRLKSQPVFAGKSIVCPKCKTKQFIPQPVESEEEVDLSSTEMRKLEQFPPAGVKRPPAGPRPPVGPPLVPVPRAGNDPRTAAELSPPVVAPSPAMPKVPVARAIPAGAPQPMPAIPIPAAPPIPVAKLIAPPPGAVVPALPVTAVVPAMPMVPPVPPPAVAPTPPPLPPMPAPGSLAMSSGDVADLVEIVDEPQAVAAPTPSSADDDFDLLEIIEESTPPPPAS